MKISKSKRVFSLLIVTTFALFGLLVLCPVSIFAESVNVSVIYNNSVGGSRNYNFYISRRGTSTYDNAFTVKNGAVLSSNLYIGEFSYTYSSYYQQGNRYFQSLTIIADGVSYSVSTDGSSSTYIPEASSYTFSFSSVSTTLYYFYFVIGSNSTPTPTPTPTSTPTPTPSPTPDPADWLNNYIFNQTSEDMWVGVEDINADDVTYDVIPAWSYKNFYFKRNTTYKITARTEQDNVYYSLQYYTDLYNYVPLEYSLSSEGWYTYTELPYTSINISTGSDTNTSGIYTFVRFRHDLPTLPPVTPVPGTSFTPGPSSTPTEAPYVTPIPSNPTLIPDDSTPTPIPDISGEAVAGFNKLTNIFNGIFDAAYQSVNAANGNFWTSFFFIGLPIFLVILGLIAWIIFGSSDDY